jgi:hypothetical protein
MSDQELIFAALRQVGLIVAEHLEVGTSDTDEAITQLVAVLDTPELAAAMNRVERGYGLRMLKWRTVYTLWINTDSAWTKASQFKKIPSRIVAGAWSMNLSNTKDESLIVYYENVRRQVQADMKAGGRYRLVGETTKQYADKIREEMDRRRLRFTPIDWHR